MSRQSKSNLWKNATPSSPLIKRCASFPPLKSEFYVIISKTKIKLKKKLLLNVLLHIYATPFGLLNQILAS